MNRIMNWNWNDLSPQNINVLLWLFGFAFGVGMIIQSFFLETLARTLRLCREENRQMRPGFVWLNMIPFFATVWIFITVRRVAESLRAEFNDPEGEYSEKLGYTYNVLFILGIIPLVGGLFSIGGLIGYVVYWVRMTEHNTALKAKRFCTRKRKPASRLHTLPRFA